MCSSANTEPVQSPVARSLVFRMQLYHSSVATCTRLVYFGFVSERSYNRLGRMTAFTSLQVRMSKVVRHSVLAVSYLRFEKSAVRSDLYTCPSELTGGLHRSSLVSVADPITEDSRSVYIGRSSRSENRCL